MLLARAVRSVLNQTHRDLEVLIIDNNQGEPPVRAENFSDDRVRVLPARHCGNAAAARNAGLDAASGEWVSYLDDDDEYLPQKIGRQHERASTAPANLVLCGAAFHLKGRVRRVQSVQGWTGDELLLRARWNTPLIFHRHPGEMRFSERLSPGEDAEFAHRLLAADRTEFVPVCGEPLVNIFPQPGARVNRNPEPVMRAARMILALRPGFYSRNARRRYLLQNFLAPAKLQGDTTRCIRIGWRLLRESRGRDWRAVANAVLVSTGWFRDSLVS